MRAATHKSSYLKVNTYRITNTWPPLWDSNLLLSYLLPDQKSSSVSVMIDGYVVSGAEKRILRENDNHAQCIQVCGAVHTVLPSKRVNFAKGGLARLLFALALDSLAPKTDWVHIIIMSSLACSWEWPPTPSFDIPFFWHHLVSTNQLINRYRWSDNDTIDTFTA